MSFSARLRASSRVASIHFCISLALVLGVASFVLLVWFPGGLYRLTGGMGLFVVLLLVDLVCGPGLTLVLFDPNKSKWKWRIDIALIAVVQFAALGYGVFQIAKIRPVYLAFEADRFRVVQAQDVDVSQLADAPPSLRSLSWTGPQPLGTRLLAAGHPDYLNSIQESLKGFHPAFRPSRWISYESQAQEIIASAKPLVELELKQTKSRDILLDAVVATGLRQDQLGYLPLVRDFDTDWIVIVDLQTARLVGWLPIDGW